MSTIGFCIGNGTSREGYDLERLNGHGVTIGCNCIWKHYTPDYVVALDDHEREWIEVLRVPPFKLITRTDNDILLDGKPISTRRGYNGGLNNNSGIVAAVYLAEYLKVDTVYMLGIDFFRDVIGRTSNDLYAKTTIGTKALPKIWEAIAARNPNTKFVRVGNIEHYDQRFFDNDLHGFELMNYERFPY